MTSLNDNGLILLIGGRSRRANLDVKKQFYPVDGEALFIHAIRSLFILPFKHSVLVAPAEDRETALKHLQKANIDIPVVDGGNERVDSVMNGMRALASSGIGYVFIHDGVRPLVPKSDLEQLEKAVHMHDAAILAAPVTDTIKAVREGVITGSPERSTLWRALTPQAFSYERYMTALNAYRADASRIPATDDAAVYAAYAGDVHIVPGDPCNIKVTHAEDIEIFRTLKKNVNSIG
ncbi:MAG: IspD/TarI family cytidylyltransferase [Spirochaetota bacterium]